MLVEQAVGLDLLLARSYQVKLIFHVHFVPRPTGDSGGLSLEIFGADGLSVHPLIVGLAWQRERRMGGQTLTMTTQISWIS